MFYVILESKLSWIFCQLFRMWITEIICDNWKDKVIDISSQLIRDKWKFMLLCNYYISMREWKFLNEYTFHSEIPCIQSREILVETISKWVFFDSFFIFWAKQENEPAFYLYISVFHYDSSGKHKFAWDST